MTSRPFTAALLGVLLASHAAGQKPREAAGSAPPPVVSQAVVVKRGGEILIPLSIHGVRGEALEFLIRTPPAHGRLSGIASRGMNAASVTYSSSPAAQAAEDRFTYAVRGSEGVSAPGLVSITITEPVVAPARIVVPEALDFPPVTAGQRSTAELELVNRGGTVAEGRLSVSGPWSVEGSADYRIAPGGRHGMKIAFKADKAGTHDGKAELPGPPRKIIALRAVAEERITATPSRVELVSQPGSQTRKGVVHLSNRSAENVKITLDAGPRLMTDHVVAIPPLGEIDVPVFADAGDVSAFEQELKLSSGEWSAAIKVHVPEMSPVLRFVKGDGVFGVLTAGRPAEGLATLENLGGRATAVRLEIEPPFQLQSTAVTVPAKGRVDIPVRMAKPDPGVHAASLHATADGQTAKLDLRAEVAQAAQVPKPGVAGGDLPKRTGPAPAPAPEPARQKEADIPKEFALLPTTKEEQPNAMGRFAKEVRSTSAVLEWPAELGANDNLRFEERELFLSADGELQAKWVPCSNARVQPAGDRIRAELGGLAPGTLHTIRVIAGQGDASATRFTVEFFTPAKKPFFRFGWRLPLLLASGALLGVLLWRRWKLRRSAGW